MIDATMETINEQVSSQEAPSETASYMSREDYEKTLEAILFAAGHPVTYEQLAKTFEIPTSEMRSIVYDYAAKYNNTDIPRGVSLITYDSCCQLCTKPEYIRPIRTVLGIRKSAGTLSNSTIEALTIIAYQQPVTRAYIDSVRNADSSYAISNLLDRGLIEPKGRKDVPGRPILYGTTHAFLRCFGLASLDDLPGSEGEADKIFKAIDSRLHISAEGDLEGQVSIDDMMFGMSGETPQDTPVEAITQISIADMSEDAPEDKTDADGVASVQAEDSEETEFEDISAAEEAMRLMGQE